MRRTKGESEHQPERTSPGAETESNFERPGQ